MFARAPGTLLMLPSNRLPALLSAVRRTRWPAWRFAVRAWLAMPSVELALRTAGVKRTLAWLERLPAQPAEGAPASIEEATRMVRWASKLQPLVEGACLTRSLTQYALHCRDGTAARFVIGVRKPGADAAAQPISLDAHAWVQPPGAASPEPAYTEILHREQHG